MTDQLGTSSSASSYSDVTESAYQRIRDSILSGELPPDSIISQVQLSEQLGVSRTPLREAIRRLEQDGLLLASARRRVRVASADLAEFDTLCAMRIVVEALAIRLTVPALTDAQVDHIEALHGRLRDGRDSVQEPWWDETHREFHRALIAGASGRIEVAINSIYDHAARYRAASVEWWRDYDPDIEIPDHEGLVRAVRARDAEEASLLLAEHYARSVLDPNAIAGGPTFGVAVRSAAAMIVGDDVAPS